MRRLIGLALVCSLAPISVAVASPDEAEPNAHVQSANALPDAETHQAKVQEAALKRAMRRLTEELGLVQNQVDRLQPILKQHYADLQQVRLDVRELEGPQARSAYTFEAERLRETMHEKLRDVLTQPQLERFIELRSQMKNRALAAQEPL